MNTETLDIRPLTPQEPLRPDEIALTPEQAATLEPMSRVERRAWLRDKKRADKKDQRRVLREVRRLIDAERIYATSKASLEAEQSNG